MIFIDNILNFVTDTKKRLSTRATIFIISIIAFLVFDNIIGFSHYYNQQKQLDQLKTISELLEKKSLSAKSKKELKKLESETFERQDMLDYSMSFLKNISSTDNKQSQNITNTETKTIRSNIWFLISSSGIYILTTFLVVPVLLITDRETAFLKLLASMIMFCIVMFFTSWFNYWLFDKIIPDELFGSWVWNYIINFIIQIGLLVGLYYSTKTIENTTASY
ncbi:hypothetical protein G1K66_12405 [Tenacibaculum finnmarkense]|uniref:hypothetical protein n=1 Tax=Tenacibaculum finnmarkense TaxID=2781243 RepID=UPI001E5658AE|nr:hypothetical protein [Tenacibaculum finnmarkense]MCD8401398.1 hypothetical protein [Tenacibaculum finnmarkense genomovar ulcerans]MCG8814058.1 hypothetical protein [Tenacibaculum finnmarkense]